jgi:hypothetical protein
LRMLVPHENCMISIQAATTAGGLHQAVYRQYCNSLTRADKGEALHTLLIFTLKR